VESLADLSILHRSGAGLKGAAAPIPLLSRERRSHPAEGHHADISPTPAPRRSPSGLGVRADRHRPGGRAFPAREIRAPRRRGRPRRHRGALARKPRRSPLHDRRVPRGGARPAGAFDRAIFSDYAASFAGWGEAEVTRFRLGQRAYDEARAAVEESRFEDALRLARESVELAEPLGDWWGTAAGLAAEGAALERLGRLEEALARRARSRLLHQQLGLPGSELRDLVALGRILEHLDRPVRARIAVERGLALSVELGVVPARADLLRVRAALEERAGDLEAARATLRELLALLASTGAEGEGE
jgi:hypothetical protein